ncbi:MAG: hypothetical protein ACI4TX_01715, partial [Christensenellales bacterium]
ILFFLKFLVSHHLQTYILIISNNRSHMASNAEHYFHSFLIYQGFAFAICFAYVICKVEMCNY